MGYYSATFSYNEAYRFLKWANKLGAHKYLHKWNGSEAHRIINRAMYYAGGNPRRYLAWKVARRLGVDDAH